MTRLDIFIAGVPATGKTWLGQWLAEKHDYIHIDAEKKNGADFDKAGVHEEWDEMLSTGHAATFVNAIRNLSKPVIVNWGFPTSHLYVVSALQEKGVPTWWFNAPRDLARRAFVDRGKIDPNCFDRQMNNIEREWLLIKSVFQPCIVDGLLSDGSQRKPEDIWREIIRKG